MKCKIRDFQPDLSYPGCITEEEKTDLYFKTRVQCCRERQIDASDKKHVISGVFFCWWGAFILIWVPDISTKNYKGEKNDANPQYQQCLTCQA